MALTEREIIEEQSVRNHRKRAKSPEQWFETQPRYGPQTQTPKFTESRLDALCTHVRCHVRVLSAAPSVEPQLHDLKGHPTLRATEKRSPVNGGLRGFKKSNS